MCGNNRNNEGRKNKQIECNICNKWKSMDHIGVEKKQDRCINERMIKCRSYLIIEKEMLWRKIEERRTVDKWNKIENQ